MRYVRERPGELVHVDVKKLPAIPLGGGWRLHERGNAPTHSPVGYRYLHTAIDDCTRLAYSEDLDNERGATAAAFWRRAYAFFAACDITCERVLTDNGACYRSADWQTACAQTATSPKRTRPYRPQTNCQYALCAREGRHAGVGGGVVTHNHQHLQRRQRRRVAFVWVAQRRHHHLLGQRPRRVRDRRRPPHRRDRALQRHRLALTPGEASDRAVAATGGGDDEPTSSGEVQQRPRGSQALGEGASDRPREIPGILPRCTTSL